MGMSVLQIEKALDFVPAKFLCKAYANVYDHGGFKNDTLYNFTISFLNSGKRQMNEEDRKPLTQEMAYYIDENFFDIPVDRYVVDIVMRLGDKNSIYLRNV